MESVVALVLQQMFALAQGHGTILATTKCGGYPCKAIACRGWEPRDAQPTCALERFLWVLKQRVTTSKYTRHKFAWVGSNKANILPSMGIRAVAGCSPMCTVRSAVPLGLGRSGMAWQSHAQFEVHTSWTLGLMFEAATVCTLNHRVCSKYTGSSTFEVASASQIHPPRREVS
eukprot:4093528-Amphidinium_carterae.1